MATILFSPIGGNDPVSSSTEADGSMLHICRHYRPDRVFLYLSAEMAARQDKDKRYTWCINELGNKIGHKFETELIKRCNLEKVYDFDFYYEEFHTLIKKITGEMKPEDRLLLNISSGTPAMKSELLITAVMSERNIIPIQVTTPEKRINVHTGADPDYDPEYYWEINKDNEEGAENRCIEVKCPNLTALLKKDIIARHIAAYDYTAAYSIAKEMPEHIPEKALRLMELSVNRIQMNIFKVSEIENHNKFNIRKKFGSDQEMIFEYTLMLGIKLKRGEFGDFIRAVSPLLTDLFVCMLKNKCGIDIEKMCKITQKGYVLSRDRLLQTEKGRDILSLLDAEFREPYREMPLSAANLKPVLCGYIKDVRTKNNIELIRKIEEKVRNTLAHEIVSIDDVKLKKMLGEDITMSRVYKLIVSIMRDAGVNATDDDLNSYDAMNKIITEELYS